MNSNAESDTFERELEEFLEEHPDFAETMRNCREYHRVLEEDSFSGLGPGRMLGSYRLERMLGSGGMGVVYEARQEPLGRRVALKVLAPGLLRDRRAVDRLWSEARITSRLDHPAICTVYDVGVHGGAPYLAMRYVEGETLERKIARSRSGPRGSESLPMDTADLSVTELSSPEEGWAERSALGPAESAVLPDRAGIEESVLLVEKCARAFHAAHEAGVIHRDVKPSNIMVSEGDEPVILDFGLARELEGSLPALTRSGDVLGTPAYMSPEQIEASRRRIDRRTDIYSLGVTLYECLTLRPPFEAPTRAGLFHAILKTDPPDCRWLNRQVPKDLAVVIETALEKDVERRYQTAYEFAEDLRRVREREPIRARPPGPALRFRRWAERNPALAVSVLAVVVLLVTALSMSLGYSKRLSEEVVEKEAALREKQTALELLEAQKEELRVEREKLTSEVQRSQGLLLSGFHSKEALANDPGLALLLAIEGAKLHRGVVANNALLNALDALYEERPLRGHEDDVEAASFSSSGDRLVTVSRDGTARIWDAERGEELLTLRGHKGWLRTGWFSPAGDRVVTASRDGTARIWDAATGRELHTLRGHEDEVNSARFSPDGDRVVTASRDRTARIWDAASGAELAVLRGHGGTLFSARFSPDGRRVATASWDETARIWDATSGRELLNLVHDNDDGVDDARFSPDGRRVLTADCDAYIWDAETGDELVTFGEAKCVLRSAAFSFSPKGSRVVTGHYGSSVRIWDATSGEELLTLERHVDDESLRSAIFSPDAKQVLTAWEDGTARIWDARSGEELFVLRGHKRVVHAARFGPGGERVVTASADGTARIWSTVPEKAMVTLKAGGQNAHVVQSAHFSPDGKRIVTASNYEGRAWIWDAVTGDLILVLRGHRGGVNSARFSPDGRRVVTASEDGTARIWDATTGDELLVLTGHEPEPPRGNSVRAARFSPDGELVVTVGLDSAARIWNAATGDELLVLRHGRRKISARFSPDGKKVVTASWDKTARIWDATTGEELLALRRQGEDTTFGSARFSPEGERVLTVGSDETAQIWDATSGEELVILGRRESDLSFAEFSPEGERVLTMGPGAGTARIWDARTGDELLTLTGHGRALNCGYFSPDGERVVTASRDRTARIWDATTGEELLTLRGHERGVNCARFSPDGRRLVTASWDGTRIWPADPLPLAMRRKPRELTPDEVDRYEIGAPAERRAYRRRWEVEKLRRRIEIAGRVLSADPDQELQRRELDESLRALVRQLARTPAESEIERVLECVTAAVEASGMSPSDADRILSEIQALDADGAGRRRNPWHEQAGERP